MYLIQNTSIVDKFYIISIDLQYWSFLIEDNIYIYVANTSNKYFINKSYVSSYEIFSLINHCKCSFEHICKFVSIYVTQKCMNCADCSDTSSLSNERFCVDYTFRSPYVSVTI